MAHADMLPRFHLDSLVLGAPTVLYCRTTAPVRLSSELQFNHLFFLYRYRLRLSVLILNL
jgi:hypothetical protein